MTYFTTTPNKPKFTLPERGRGPFREYPYPEERINHRPVSRHTLWLERMMEHGPQNTRFLYEITRATHRSYEGTQHSVKTLWRSGFIYRPRQQTQTDNVNYNHYVYDITPKGKQWLEEQGLWRETYRDQADWRHQYMISAVQTSIRVLAEREGFRYLTRDQYFGAMEINRPIPFYWKDDLRESDLNPDPPFVIDYGDKRVIYFLECDRGTEHWDSKSFKKSTTKRKLLQYDYLVGQKFYQQAYGVTDEAKVLFITTQAGRANNFLEKSQEALGPLPWLCVQLATNFGEYFEPPKDLLTHLWNDPYARPGHKPWTLKPL